MTDFARIGDPSLLPQHLRGAVVAIGNFDGVHRGHQAVLQRALDEAARLSAPALVLTFEPHPRKVFRPEVPLFVLTPPPMRARILHQLGFDHKKLTYRFQGRDYRLTDVHGEVVQGILS